MGPEATASAEETAIAIKPAQNNRNLRHAKFLTGCWIGLEFIGPLNTN